MRKKRAFIEGAAYHVTSRTNDKTQVFKYPAGSKTMLLVLKEAKEKFAFRLTNFCVMPTHIHLLIIPGEGGSLSQIMHWIKTLSAKRWNRIHGSIDHLWGTRYFARLIKDPHDYFRIMTYIDQNPIKAGLTPSVGDWKPSGAYHIRNNLSGLVDYTALTRLPYIPLLPPVPGAF
jgi:putative transposase